MPKYKLRAWETQTLIAWYDYEVEATSLEAAARLMLDAQEEAQDDGYVARVIGVRRITSLGHDGHCITEEGVRQLDPTDIHDSEMGVRLLDDQGNELGEVTPAQPPDWPMTHDGLAAEQGHG